MNRKMHFPLVLAVLAVIGLTGCASPTGPTGEPPAVSQPSENEPAAGGASLSTADSAFGEILVDGDGMSVYVFDNDTPDSGVSSCAGVCLNNWPPVIVDSETPEATGVDGTLGAIDTASGELQATINGWPLYYYAGDTAAGDTTGQGLQGIWWLVTPTGEKITDTEGSSDGFGY